MNTQLTNLTNNTATMTSREIASLTDKRHDNVIRDIENLNRTYLEMSLLKVEEGSYTHSNTGSQQHRQFILNKEQTLDLITGYTPVLRIKINRRWAELEEQVANPQPVLPATYLEALEALVSTEKQKQEVTQQLELAQYQATVNAPKVEMFDLMIDKKVLKSVSAVAKDHGVSAQALNKVLNKCNNMYDKRSSVKNQFVIKVIQDGDGRTVLDREGRPISMFTIKGEAKLVEKVLYTETAKNIFENHYKKTPKKLEEYRKKYEAVTEARTNPVETNIARIEHTEATIRTINNMLK